MKWVLNGQLQSTLTIPFYLVGRTETFQVRLTTEPEESIDRAYLCVLNSEAVGHVWARIKDTSKWYRVGGIWDTEAFLGSLGEWTFIDIEIKIQFPASSSGGATTLPFIVMHGNYEHGPNRNFCAEDDESNDPLWGDDEFEVPLWTGSQGGCPVYETGSSCGVPVYGHAVPVQSMAKYSLVTTFIDNDVKKVQQVYTDTLQSAAVVGILIDDAIDFHQAVGTATVQSDDGRYIYEHGGQEVDSEGNFITAWHNEVRVLDTTTGIWRDLGNCGEYMQRDHTLTLVDNKLYIFGGDNGAGLYYNSLFSFDLITLECTRLADAPTRRAGAGSMIYEGEIHYIGGWNDSGPIVDVDFYDIETDFWATNFYPSDLERPKIFPFVGFASGWTTLAKQPEMTIDFMACLDDRIYAWGFVERYDEELGTVKDYYMQIFPNASTGWDSFPLPAIEEIPGFPVEGGKAVAYNGKIYVCDPFLSSYIDDFYTGPFPMHIYDPTDDTWTSITESLPPELNIGSVYIPCGAAVVDNKIYFWGGLDNGAQPTIILVFYLDTLTWDSVIHEVGTPRNPWNGAVVNGVLYQYTREAGQQAITLSNFTWHPIFAQVDSEMEPVWACECEGKVFWLMRHGTSPEE
jgi:N-acetylneuraminic acid mutarotase